MLKTIAAILVVWLANAPSAFAFDPIRDDISGFTLATRLSPQPSVTIATLTVSATHPDGETVTESFTLVPVTGRGYVPKAATEFYGLDPADTSRLDAIRTRIEVWENAAPDTRGSIGFGLDTGEDTGIRATIWVSPDRNAPFERLMKNAPIN